MTEISINNYLCKKANFGTPQVVMHQDNLLTSDLKFNTPAFPLLSEPFPLSPPYLHGIP